MTNLPCFHLLLRKEIFGEEKEEDENERSDTNKERTGEVHIRRNLLIDKCLLLCWVVDILHHLVSFLRCFLAGKEDAHRRDSFILLEGIDKQPFPLRLEGMNQMNINQTIPMSHIGRRHFQCMTPEIINSWHVR
jgi:hypothetical protein